MTISEFKYWYEHKKPKVIIYNDENDIKRGIPSHFDALHLTLAFTCIHTYFNPNTICLQGDCGKISIYGVKNIALHNNSLLGDIITVYADVGSGTKGYTLIID